MSMYYIRGRYKVPADMSLDYDALMELARKNARAESARLFPFWQYSRRIKAYHSLVIKYFREYTVTCNTTT